MLLYVARATLRGRFAAPSFEAWGVAPADVLWDEATLEIGVSDMSGLRRLALAVGGRPVAVEPGPHVFRSGALARLAGVSLQAGADFAIEIVLDGSGALQVLPVGAESEVKIAGDWPHPGFIGAFLPIEREIGADGFAARWTVPELARNFPQAWQERDVSADALAEAGVGVQLALPGDVYQQTDRIAKYGILLVGLTFATIFVLGIVRPARAHFVQYLLVAASICVFYLLLLSLSEHVAFPIAYAIASAIDVVVVALYAARTIRPLLGAVLAGLLALVHGFMYLLIQAEDYALLAGSIGLLLVLVATMIVTRSIDWFAIGEEGRRDDAPLPAGTA